MTRRRRWLEGCVIAIAALASIATSRRRWFLEAELPATGIRGPALVIVESSREPHLLLQKPAKREGSPPEGQRVVQSEAWPGTTHFLVPTGAEVSAIHMPGDHCKGGLCSSDCTVPDGEFVKVVKVTRVATWKLEVSGTQRTDRLDPTRLDSHKLFVAASVPGTWSLTVESTIEPSQITTSPLAVYWPDVDKPTEVTWTPRLVLEGACPDTTPCEPPPTAKLEIQDIRADGILRTPAEQKQQ